MRNGAQRCCVGASHLRRSGGIAACDGAMQRICDLPCSVLHASPSTELM
jgi:hypothetical protein